MAWQIHSFPYFLFHDLHTGRDRWDSLGHLGQAGVSDIEVGLSGAASLKLKYR
jgi:hypothetical protein